MSRRRMIAITDIGPKSTWASHAPSLIGLVGVLLRDRVWRDGWHGIELLPNSLSLRLLGLYPEFEQFMGENKLHIHQCHYTEVAIDDDNED